MASPSNSVINNYPNPLDNFRTYSYHFVMTLASTTQAFIDQLGGGTNGATSQSSNSPSPLLSAVLSATAPGQKIHIGQSDVYLILDTRRFSQYSVVDFDMTHVYGTGDTVNPTTPVGMHTMTVIDTTGISFFNMLMDMFRNKVQSQRGSAFFLLAIMFVGHKDDGTTETVATTYIPMNLLTMGLQFTASGSTFEMAFAEQEGGISRGGSGTSQMNYLGDVKSISTKGLTNTVGGMILALERDLNLKSLDFFQKYSNAVVTKTDAQGNPLKIGKLVQYMITIPNEWANFSLDTAEQSSNTEKMYIAATVDAITDKEAAEQASLAVLKPGSSFSSMKFSDATTIPDAIKGILESSTDMLKMATTDNLNSGLAVTFKILTVVTSDDTTYTVHYDVYPYYHPLVKDNKQDSGNNTATTTKVTAGSTTNDSAQQYQNVITYSYLFSGKNDAIINLDVKFDPESAVTALDTNLNIGTARFGELAAIGQNKQKVSQNSTGAQKSVNLYAPDIRQNDPIFIPIKSKDQKTNDAANKNGEGTSQPVSQSNLNLKQQYTQTMASVHFLSNVQLDMTIRGNPNIVAKFADRGYRGCPPHGPSMKPDQINTLTHSGQNTASSNYNSILLPILQTAKQAYYKNYYYPRVQAVKAPPKSTSSTNADTLKNGPDVAVHPIFVLVKIYAPNLDETGNYISGSPMFTDEFFFNGVYELMLINSKFQQGEFTQVLTMRADPAVSSQNDVPAGAK